MLIALPSIMHSGTHVLKNCVLKGENYQVIYKHVLNNLKEDTEKLFKEADCIISPMRHPVRILASFKSRNRAVNDEEQIALVQKHYSHLPTHTYKGVLKNILEQGETYEKQWELLKYYMDRYDINFIHVDDFSGRDTRIDELSSKLGIELKHHWPVNKKSGSEHGNHNIELTDEMISKVPNWIMNIYNETLSDVSDKDCHAA